MKPTSSIRHRWKARVTPVIFSAAAAAALWATSGSARADTLIFNSLNGTASTSNRSAEFSPGSEITASANTLIDAIAVDVDLAAAGNLKFLIFSNTGTLLYQSAPQNFADDGLTFKKSAPFVFTLLAGQTYEIGAISDTAGFWSYDTTPGTQGSLSSDSTNPNFSTYAAPTVAVQNGSADGSVELFAPIPEPSTWAMMFAGLGLLVGAVRFRRLRQA